MTQIMTYIKIIAKIESDIYKLGEKYFCSDKGIDEDEFTEIIENIAIGLTSLKIEIRDHLREIKYLSEIIAAYEKEDKKEDKKETGYENYDRDYVWKGEDE